MKHIKHLCCTSILVFMGAMALTACGDEEYDFDGDIYNRVYLSNNTSATSVLTVTDFYVNFDLDCYIALKCTKPASEDIRVTVELDNSLVDVYNAEQGTSYASLPEEALVFNSNELIIESGTYAPTDSLHVSGTTDTAVLSSLTDENGYVLPLSIVSVKGGGAQISTNMSTVYLTVSFSQNLVNADASASDITGSLLADQSGWSITTDGDNAQEVDLTTLFNGDSSTYIQIGSSDADYHIDIDMGQSYTFDAIAFYYYYSYWWWSYEVGSFMSGMTISISDDASMWNTIGEIESNNISPCVFYTPVTSRYIRLTVPSGTSLQAGVFNIYATN